MTRAGANLGPIDPVPFIRERLRLAPVPGLPQIHLYTAHQDTGLWRLGELDRAIDPPAPYWAFPWAGGLALARHIVERPETVAGRRVFDIGAGSGLVAVAAARAGARAVVAAEIDPLAIVAIAENAAANGVAVTIAHGDATARAPPDADIVLAGDVFYAPAVADRMTAFFERCRVAGLDVLVGDPGRADLPEARLRRLADYLVPDVGEGAARPSGVFAFAAADGG